MSPQDLDAKQQARAEVVAKELKDFEQRMTPQERAFPVFFWAVGPLMIGWMSYASKLLPIDYGSE